jgi:hypothetical protein
MSQLLLTLALAASSAPTGWWIVESSSGQDVGRPGAAWQFGQEVVTVDAQRQAARRTRFDCVAVKTGSWRCTRTANGEVHILDLNLRPGGELVATLTRAGQPAYGQLDARPARAEESRGLDALAERAHADDLAACSQTKRCYDLACPAFGDPQDPCIFERHSMSHDASTCRALLPMLVNTLQAIDKPVPPECLAKP